MPHNDIGWFAMFQSSKGAQTHKLWGPDVFQLGEGLPREGVERKSLVCPLKLMGGYYVGYPGGARHVREKFVCAMPSKA